jgi:hypothetical protein
MWLGGGYPAPAPALHPVYQRTYAPAAPAAPAHAAAGQEAHHVARALPEFRPPVFVGNLPCPESPDSSPEKPKPTTDVLAESPDKGGDTCDVRALQRQVAQLESEKAGVEDQLRRALQKIKAQEQTINELRSGRGGAEESCTE